MFKTLTRQICGIAMLLAATGGAHATFHLWVIDEIYSNADGTVQFIELSNSNSGEQFVGAHSITCTQGSTTHTFTVPTNLPTSIDTTNRTFLIGTQGFAALNGV